MLVMQLRNFLTSSSLPKLIQRHYSFTVNLSVKSIDSMEIKADKTFGPNRKVKVEVYDSHGQLQNGSQLNAIHREDGFYMNYNRSEDDKLVVSLPLTSQLAQYDVRVHGEKSSVKIDNLIMNSLKIEVARGDIDVQAVRLNNCEISTADSIKVVGLFSPQLDKIHLNSSEGLVEVIECRCSELLAIGKSVKIWNCFNSLNKIKASVETTITNLLGCTTVEAGGEKVHISGIAGTFNAYLSAKWNQIDLIMLHGHDNEIVLKNPDAKTLLKFPARMINKLSKVLISAKPEIITQSGDDIELDRLGENSFEIVRISGGEGESTLNVKVEEGKELQLHRQSWLDGFSWAKKIFSS